jgi:hypothetical protein
LSSQVSHPLPPLPTEPFRGGGRWLTVGGALGAVLFLASLGGFAVDAREAFFSYLVAFAYWAGLAMASVILLMMLHATRARWVTVMRRPVEAMAASVPIFILLFIPLLFGLKHLYIWVDPAADLGKETLRLLAHKRPWLNPSFFIVRGFFYLVLASFFAWRLYAWSQRQDREGGVELLARQRSLSAGGLPFIGLGMTFAAFDWLMSLNPTWFSTIYGVYYFAGSIGAALSLLAVIMDYSRVRNVFGGLVSVEHTHNIGKLMLAFVCFWTYVAFSQLLLIWIAGLPEEIPFYIVRFNPGWRFVGIFLIFGHFFLPFGALLSRSLKRNPRKLAIVGVWILLVNYIDVFWLVMPTLHPEGFSMHWTNFTSFLGVGLLAVAFGVSRLRGRLPIPVKDPYLSESLRYRQP